MVRKRSLISVTERFRSSQSPSFGFSTGGTLQTRPRSDVREIHLLTGRNASELLDIHRHDGDCPGRILIGRIFLSLEEMPQVLGKFRLCRRSFCKKTDAANVYSHERRRQLYVFQALILLWKFLALQTQWREIRLKWNFQEKFKESVFVSWQSFLKSNGPVVKLQ